MANMIRIDIIIGALLLPVLIIFIAIKIWDAKAKKMTSEDREDSIAKIAIAGTVITSMAIIYGIIFNFYNFGKLYKRK